MKYRRKHEDGKIASLDCKRERGVQLEAVTYFTYSEFALWTDYTRDYGSSPRRAACAANALPGVGHVPERGALYTRVEGV